MKIRLAVLDGDRSYLSRIASALTDKYSEKLEVYSFSDAAIATGAMRESKIDVLLAADSFEIDTRSLPQKCAFAYLVEPRDTVELRGQRAVSKFQRLDAIYNAVVDLYAEISGAAVIQTSDRSGLNVFVFTSASGGAGTSTAAVACAKSFAMSGIKTLYLNLERFGCADSFLSGEGAFDLGDVIFALKSRRTNLALKLESNVRRDASGVYFFAASKNALDVTELSAEDISTLLGAVKQSGLFERVVVDMNIALDEQAMTLIYEAAVTVFVSDGTEVANAKFLRAVEALRVMTAERDSSVMHRLAIFYNRFGSRFSRKVETDVRDAGGAPRIENATPEQIVAELVNRNLFTQL